MAEGKNPHSGHRSRVKQQFLTYGGEHLHDHQILELILFYALPQRDVNPLAHTLLDTFGNLHSLMNAPASELKKVEGISDHTAALIKLFPEVARRYYQEEIDPGTIVNCSEDAAAVLSPCFVGAEVEMVYLLCADAKGKLLGCERITRGAVDAVLVDQRRIVEKALQYRASQIYVAHCHINGLARPSMEDISSTRRLQQTLESMGISLADHLIFADGDYVSLAQSGMLSSGIRR